ncbi:MAG: hypothetical protein ACREIT_04230 [Tepidisphaeraceae bacterium]
MSSDPRDYKLELSSTTPSEPRTGPRPFLSVRFACCSVYQRIYRDNDGKSYRGRCPKCGKCVQFPLGEGGTDCRQFVVY